MNLSENSLLDRCNHNLGLDDFDWSSGLQRDKLVSVLPSRRIGQIGNSTSVSIRFHRKVVRWLLRRKMLTEHFELTGVIRLASAGRSKLLIYLDHQTENLERGTH